MLRNINIIKTIHLLASICVITSNCVINEYITKSAYKSITMHSWIICALFSDIANFREVQDYGRRRISCDGDASNHCFTTRGSFRCYEVVRLCAGICIYLYIDIRVRCVYICQVYTQLCLPTELAHNSPEGNLHVLYATRRTLSFTISRA